MVPAVIMDCRMCPIIYMWCTTSEKVAWNYASAIGYHIECDLELFG